MRSRSRFIVSAIPPRWCYPRTACSSSRGEVATFRKTLTEPNHILGDRNMKSLGGKPEGARLERIMAPPLWAGERFRNVHPVIQGLRDPNASMPTVGDFLCGGERRVPRGPLPSMNPLEAWTRLGACRTCFHVCVAVQKAMIARRSARRIAWPIRKPSNAARAPFGQQPEGTGRFGRIPALPAACSGVTLRRGRRLGLHPKAPRRMRESKSDRLLD